jgi:integrase
MPDHEQNRSVPTYRKHKQSGQAVVTLTNGMGKRRDVLLGKHGTQASRQEYARVIAEWEANGRRLPASEAAGRRDLTVNELAVAFLRHAENHYRHPDGTPTGELADCKLSLRPLTHLYGLTCAADFGPLALKAVRDLMVKGYQHPKRGEQERLARGVVNQRVGRIRRLFRWAVENEMVPPSLLHGLQAVAGLKRGRTDCRETEPVRPVPEDLVNQTLPFVTRPVRGMILVQLHTGMRPGEVCVMRACDIDMSGTVWLYRPAQHKTAHHGHQRAIAIGPKAQAIVREYLTLDTTAYLFSPRQAMAEFRARIRQKRKTVVQPSQQDRRKKQPSRTPREHYTTMSYGKAIRHGVAMANKAGACDACKARKPAVRCEDCQAGALPSWHPHQLRHTAATKIRKEFGLDVARVVLGHRSPAITELYAELDTSRAAEVMQKLG